MSLNPLFDRELFKMYPPTSNPAVRRARLQHLLSDGIGEPPTTPSPAPRLRPPPPAAAILRSDADEHRFYTPRSYQGSSDRLLAWVNDRRERNLRRRVALARDGTLFWETSSEEEYRDCSAVDTSSAESSMGAIDPVVMAVSKKVYPVEMLIELHNTLPELKCDLKQFSADAWRAQILVPPGKKRCPPEPYFPADFPTTVTRKAIEIPEHHLPAYLVHACLGSSEGGTEDEGSFSNQTSKKKQRESSSLSMVSSNARLPHPNRQPVHPPKGMLSQQDAGFARFLKEVASPTHKRVTAGGRIVSAEYPPRLHGRSKKGSETAWARVPYSHITTEMPQGTNDTFLAFPNGSFYWGPQGELYVRPAPEVLFSALYPGQQAPPISLPLDDPQAYQMPLVSNEAGVQQQVPMNFNAGAQMSTGSMGGVPIQQSAFSSDPITGGLGFNNPQYAWHNQGNDALDAEASGSARNIRTPRVHFPIGSRFDYEQNQQALRDRLAQLDYEMDNLQYLTADEAELKRMEKKLVEDQIEQFRQVWELQTYLAGGEADPVTQPESQLAPGSVQAREGEQFSKSREDHQQMVSKDAPAVQNEATNSFEAGLTIVRSTAPGVQPIERKGRVNKAEMEEPSTPSKFHEEFVVQTPPSVAPIQGKENVVSMTSGQASAGTAVPTPVLPGPDQVPFCYRAGSASLRSTLLRKNAAPSIESLQLSVDLDGASAIVEGRKAAPVFEGEKGSTAAKSKGKATATIPAKSSLELKQSVESLRRSAGMPVDTIETSKIPVKKNAFTQQLQKIASASRLFFGEAPKKVSDAAEAENSNPAQPPKVTRRENTSILKDSAILEARDGNGVTIISPLILAGGKISESADKSNVGSKHRPEEISRDQKGSNWYPSVAVESLRKLYQQNLEGSPSDRKHGQRVTKTQLPMMASLKNQGSSKGKQVEAEQDLETAQQNAKVQDVLGVINDPSNQNAFLERMLKNRRYADIGFDPEDFDKLVKEEMKKHQVRRKDAAGKTEKKKAGNKLSSKAGPSMPQLSNKAAPSHPLPTPTTAQGVLHSTGSATNFPPGPSQMEKGKGKMTTARPSPVDNRTLMTGTDFTPVVASSSRTGPVDHARRNEVDAFFHQLQQEEEAEIAKYQAEHPRGR